MAIIYDDYFKTINDKVSTLIAEIRTDYNIDCGSEWESVILKMLKLILPSQYGICKGTVFDVNGESAGDDIIIYDQQRFPTLRLLDTIAPDQKQRIPIEAVVAYIEAKNSIILEDGHGNSLNKALEQSVKIKQMARKQIPFNPMYDWGMPVSDNTGTIKFAPSTNHPAINNPLYTCIFANGVREKKGGPLLAPSEVENELIGRSLAYDNNCPDLVLLNKDMVIYPEIQDTFYSPFFINPGSNFRIAIKEGEAWGIAMSLLFEAFRHIHLGSMPWKEIFAMTLNYSMR